MSTYDSIPSSQVAASLGSGVGVSEVIDWQVSRSLSGGGLPNQARATSGSSVGSGSLTAVPNSANPESPWSVNATTPGESVSIDASADVDAPLSPVARMVSRDVSADSWVSPVRTLSIEDEVPRGPVLIPEDVGRGALDACAVIDAAARAAGFTATPQHFDGCNYSLPLVGSLWSVIGGAPAMPTISDGARYATMAGTAALTDSSVTLPALGWAEEAAVLLVCQVDSGSLTITDPSVGMVLSVTPTSVQVGAGPAVSVDMAGAPHVVELHSNRVVGLASARVDGAAWSPAATLAVGDEVALTIAATAGALVNAVQVYSDGRYVLPDPAGQAWLATASAAIAASNSPLSAIAEPTSGDAWEVIQQVSAATLGACWIDEEGRLVYRNRDQLRGGEPQYTIDALDHIEDVPWSTSTDEVADRVEFTYRPPTVSVQADDTLTVWSSQETVRVAAGATVRLDRDIDGAASGLAPWFRHEDVGTYPLTRMSRYAAWTAPPGESGSAPPDGALAVSSQMLTPTRIRVAIRNTTGAPIWLYELIARARIHVAPGADITIARGLPESRAQRPLQINAGSWVQDDTTAHQIADWLESQTAVPLPTIPPVRVIPDASRRLGDVVRVRIGSISDHEPVVFKALITSIDNSQSAGAYEQRIGFTILGVTFDDWQRWGEANGITTFDQLQAALSHLTTFDALDHWLTDLGGDL